MCLQLVIGHSRYLGYHAKKSELKLKLRRCVYIFVRTIVDLFQMLKRSEKLTALRCLVQWLTVADSFQQAIPSTAKYE